MLSSGKGDIDAVLNTDKSDLTHGVAANRREDNDFLLSSLHAVDGEDLVIETNLLQITLKLVQLSVVGRDNSNGRAINVVLVDQVTREVLDHTRLLMVLVGGVRFVFLVRVINEEERDSLNDLWEMVWCLIHIYDLVLIE
jgi:hypothetical protein